MSQVVLNVLRFFSQDAVHAIGALMLLACFCRKFYAIGTGGLTVSLLLLQNRQNLPLFYYQAVIFLPLMMLAYAAAQQRFWRFIRSHGVRPQISRGAQAMLLAVPIVCAISQVPDSLAGRIKPRIFYWTTQNTNEVEQAARWINEHVAPDDLVVCHSNIAWLVKARTADFLQVTTWERLPTWPFHIPLDRTQFRYKAGLENARFVIVGDIDKRWTFLQPNVDKLVKRMLDEAWPVVWSGTHYHILQNPHWSKDSG